MTTNTIDEFRSMRMLSDISGTVCEPQVEALKGFAAVVFGSGAEIMLNQQTKSISATVALAVEPKMQDAFQKGVKTIFGSTWQAFVVTEVGNGKRTGKAGKARGISRGKRKKPAKTVRNK